MQQVTAQLRFLRIGPRKVRLVADLIRGRDVNRALTALSLVRKRAAKPLLKLLNSAVANAKHNYSLAADKLRIAQITVDGGPVLKRWMPKAHGRATPIRERTSHIRLVLEDFEPKVRKEKKDKKSKTAPAPKKK